MQNPLKSIKDFFKSYTSDNSVPKGHTRVTVERLHNVISPTPASEDLSMAAAKGWQKAATLFEEFSGDEKFARHTPKLCLLANRMAERLYDAKHGYVDVPQSVLLTLNDKRYDIYGMAKHFLDRQGSAAQENGAFLRRFADGIGKLRSNMGIDIDEAVAERIRRESRGLHTS